MTDGGVRYAVPSRTRAAAVALALSYVTFAFALVKGIVLLPLYLRFFSLGTYGAWLATANLVSLLGSLDLGLTNVLYQRLAETFGARDAAKFARIAGSGAVLLLIVPAFALVWIAAAPLLPALVNADPAVRGPLARTITLTSMGTALVLAQTSVIAVTHAWQRTEFGGVSRIAAQVFEVAATVVALFKGAGVVAFGVGSLAGGLVGFSFICVVTARHWRRMRLPRPVLAKSEVRELLGLSLPVFFSRIAAYVASNSEVAIVAAMLSPSVAAVYGITDRLFRFSQGLINPLAGSTVGTLPHLLGEAGVERVRSTVRELLAMWATGVALLLPALLALNEDFIGVWVGPDKFGGLALTLAVCLANMSYARYFFFLLVLNGIGEIARAGWAATFEPIVRLPLMVLGLKALGPAGLPIAGILGTGLLATTVFPALLGRRLGLSRRETFEFQLPGMGALALATCVSIGIAAWAPRIHGWLPLAAKASVVEVAILGVVIVSSAAIRQQIVTLGRRVRCAIDGGLERRT